MNRSVFPAAILVLSVVPGVSSQGKITVGPNVQVSKSRSGRPHYETWLATDPTNPKHLVGASMIVPAGPSRQWFETIVYSSFDGGQSWSPTLESPGNGDPAVVFGVDGSAYFAALAHEGNRETAKTLVYRSLDGGRKWLDPVPIPRWNDREYLVVDRNPGPFFGRIYMTASGIVKGSDGKDAASFDLMNSPDHGATFSAPVSIEMSKPPQGELAYNIPGNNAVLADGTIVALRATATPFSNSTHLSAANGMIGIVVSQDHGISLSPVTKVADWHVPQQSGQVPSPPVLAVDASQGPFRDRLYVAYIDLQDGRVQTYLTYSADKGKSWSSPTVVSDSVSRMRPNSGPDDSGPAIAVNSAGVVGVSWYDRRGDPDNMGYSVRFAASFDGGDSFGASVRISAGETRFGRYADPLMAIGIGGGLPARRSSVIDSLFGYGEFITKGGDTSGLAADANGLFHAFWIDARTGTPQIWATKIAVEGQAVRNGSAELAAWTDVTDKVILQFVHPTYDRKTGTIRVGACLENASSDPLSGPLRARILSVRSKLGDATIANSVRGSVTFPASEGGIKQGKRTAIVPIVIKLTAAQWPDSDVRSQLLSILKVRWKIYAKQESNHP